MKTTFHLIAASFVAVTLAACSGAPKSSSTVNSDVVQGPAWTGKVIVSPSPIPDNVEHQVIGTVKAENRIGYSGAESLYPVLAEEARKLGANGVVGVAGGRKVTFTSWSAAYVSGTAVKVDDPAVLEALGGKSL